MLKFVKYHMASITDIEIFPIISFVIFFLFFLGVLMLVFRSDKKFMSKMEQMPLEDSILANRENNEENI
jgi:cytochrome c oxidase cbb3-type subunit 4